MDSDRLFRTGQGSSAHFSPNAAAVVTGLSLSTEEAQLETDSLLFDDTPVGQAVVQHCTAASAVQPIKAAPAVQHCTAVSAVQIIKAAPAAISCTDAPYSVAGEPNQASQNARSPQSAAQRTAVVQAAPSTAAFQAALVHSAAPTVAPTDDGTAAKSFDPADPSAAAGAQDSAAAGAQEPASAGPQDSAAVGPQESAAADAQESAAADLPTIARAPLSSISSPASNRSSHEDQPFASQGKMSPLTRAGAQDKMAEQEENKATSRTSKKASFKCRLCSAKFKYR